MPRRDWSVVPTLLLLACVCLCMGCETTPAPERNPDDPTAYVDLLLTKHSPQRPIVDEVARLEAAQLTLEHAGKLGWPTEETFSEASFPEQFPAKAARLIYESTLQVYPREAFVWKPRQLDVALEVRQSNDQFLSRFRHYLQQRSPQFGLNPRAGLMADTSLVDVVRAAARLEALEAAVLLERGELDLTIDRLSAMLTIAAKLDELPHIVARLAAVELREETSYLLEAIANHPQRTARTRQRLIDIVSAQLNRWPPDQLVWQGDRAMGLHAYEMVRDGQLLSLLDEAEIEELEQKGPLRKVVTAIASQVDADQTFYLDSMRKLIDACQQPYPQRQAVIAKIEQQLSDLLNTPDYPFVAGDLLLEQLAAGNQRQVADLALWRAIGLLLGELNQQAANINPLTDLPYDIIDDGIARHITLQLTDDQTRQLVIAKQ